MDVIIQESKLLEAAAKGTDAFLSAVHDAILEAVGGEVNGETLPLLSGEQTTLLAYFILREEVMDGGFIQLIHNGYGPFIFLNPFAKAMRLWGAHEFSSSASSSIRGASSSSGMAMSLRPTVPTRSSWRSSKSTPSSTTSTTPSSRWKKR